MKNILMSIIIPAYNSGDKLTRLINSISLKYLDIIEIIVVDDYSDINQNEYIHISQIKYFRLEKNRGQGAARNFGSRMAVGKYLFFCDADDYLITEEFDKLIEWMVKKNINCDLIRTGFVEKKHKNKFNYKLAFREKYLFEDLDRYLIYTFFRKRNTTVVPFSHIYNREIFIKNMFSEIRLCSEDLDHFFLITQNIKNIYITDFIIYFYENDNSNSTTNIYGEELINKQIILYNKYIKELRNKYMLLILCIFYWFIFYPKTHIYIKGYIKGFAKSFLMSFLPAIFLRTKS